jgi:methionyl-tRNA formyltransferase
VTLRVGFAGTPGFAAQALGAILDAGFPVALVLTRPDKPKGRGLKLEPSPVKALALARGLTVLQPASLRAADARAPALAVPLDVLVVAAYGLILPAEVLSWPRHGCLNIHASRLPRWRGAAPIQRALLAGDAVTGVTIMQMDEGLDTGPMIDVVDVPIASDDTAGTLHDKLAAAGASAIVRVLERLSRGQPLARQPQPAEGASYASKIDRAEAALDWTDAADVLDRKVRAFDPAPGAYTRQQGVLVKVWQARPLAIRPSAAPGTVLACGSEGIDVACGQGALRILEVQPAGGRRMSAAAYLAGRRIVENARFDAGSDARRAGGAA